jgi:hypothetical protein
MSFSCKRCGTDFKARHHLKQHYQRVIVCEAKETDKTYAQLMEIDFPKVNKPFKCAHCDKTFTQQSNRSRHQTNCTHNNDKHKGSDVAILNGMLIDLRQEIEELRREKQGSNTNIVHNTQNIYINNLQVNNFGFESYEHITDDFVKNCLMNKITGAKNLIERIHFSDEAPLNKNIRLKSLKNSMVEVKQDEKWVAKDSNEALDTMITKGCSIMNKCYFNSEELMDRDLNILDSRIQGFLLQMMDRNNNNYFDLRRRILALIKEYTEN